MKRILLACTMLGALSAQASAATYTAANGTETFPGTFVGTVGDGATDINQIGNDQASGNAVVSSSHNPSIYEFYFAGGELNIQEELGNNGTEPNGVNAALFSRSAQADGSTPSLSSAISQVSFPYTVGGPPDPFETVYNGSLTAGYYSLDTYAPTFVADPDYQVDFSSNVPEPTAVALLGVGLLGVGMIRQRRQNAV